MNANTKKLTLEFEPENEMGVVFLFSQLARPRFGLRIQSIQAGFPDCVALKDGKSLRIEFEYRSRNFAAHRHDPKKCDWIVCWIHDWPDCPSRIHVLELRKVLGLGFSVWVVPISGAYRERISSASRGEVWSAPSQATEDDLVLFYRTSPDKFIADLFTIGAPEYQRARWKKGKDWKAKLKSRIAKLERPVHLSDLKRHDLLKGAGFVRGGFQSRYRVTPYWPSIKHLILERNPDLEERLSRI